MVIRMSDKFVVSTNTVGEIIVTDVETGNVYRRDNISNFFGLIRLMNEQQATIQSLKEENEQLRQQLLYDGDDVCGICKHEYLIPSHNYFISKCEKGHEECSKEDIEYCEDFEFKGDDNGY